MILDVLFLVGLPCRRYLRVEHNLVADWADVLARHGSGLRNFLFEFANFLLQFHLTQVHVVRLNRQKAYLEFLYLPLNLFHLQAAQREPVHFFRLEVQPCGLHFELLLVPHR